MHHFETPPPAPMPHNVQRGSCSTVRHVVVLAGYTVQGLHPYPYPYTPPVGVGCERAAQQPPLATETKK